MSSRSLMSRAGGWLSARAFNVRQRISATHKEYSAALPDGFPARKITLRVSVPPLPVHPLFGFSDHAADENGSMTQTVIARADGGFAISHDLGKSSKSFRVKGYETHRFVNLKSIGRSELLAQATPPGASASKSASVDLLVLSETGQVLAEHRAQGQRWHGCRALDMSGGTLMYAEYPSNTLVKGKRPSSARVFRSRDRGRSWKMVFEQSGRQIRHFHFLQARPGIAGEWWLTSGDLPHECRIWVSKDDGDSWIDLTASAPDRIVVDGVQFERSLFRTTDLIWLGEEVVWGTDDYLETANPPGARVFRSRIGNALSPRLVGNGRWLFRSVIDIGDFLLLLSQRSRDPEAPPPDMKPGVYLMPKKPVAGAPALLHLFNLDGYPSLEKSGFTFSKASRAALNGTFFSFRGPQDVFPTGHQILEWHVTIE